LEDISYVYVLFILLLPFEIPGWVLLSAAFALGFTVDMFSQTLGMHTAASVFMAFLRPGILRMISPRDGYETGTSPRILHMGLEWFLKYTVILVIAHHFVLFYVEVFRFSEFFSTLLRVVLSATLSVILIILSQYFIFRR
jgi:hypothetical protein